MRGNIRKFRARSDFVANESKDHYVKAFEFSSTAGIASPLLRYATLCYIIVNRVNRKIDQSKQ